MSQPAAETRPLTPLEMARNAAAAVLRYADAQDQDPVTAYAHGAGKNGMDAARLGACMALVSIAEDLHQIVRHLFMDDEPEPQTSQ